LFIRALGHGKDARSLPAVFIREKQFVSVLNKKSSFALMVAAWQISKVSAEFFNSDLLYEHQV
jgi:hypothetical protein